ncbi:TonB-dependent receptor [Undibacterium sp. JH2W]|uniref:TonB-dependent receptor n=1 Tax=Undibacterium sp. JH2W TaxID=3413037 RepID=UPI003BF3FAF4
MMQEKIIACSVRLMFIGGVAMGSGLFAHSALAQEAKTEAEKVQKVTVTGSAIKRVDTETAAPIEIYSKKDIERTGATTVSELIKNLASLDVNDSGEQTANSPVGSGVTNVKMRGLSERNVLILLNGRRLPANALADGTGAGAAVDVGSIPLSALERVEILKDGGSAIYGADAVAGVMNFITKKNYQGAEGKVGYGKSSRSDGQEKTASLVFGFGDYEQSGFNVLASLDVIKRDPIMRNAREISRSADFRRFFGGTDNRSQYSPYGNIKDGGQLKACPQEDLAGDTCRFDTNKTLLTAVNGADRFNGMFLGSLKVSNDIRAFADFTYSESKDHFQAQPAPGVYQDDKGRNISGRFMQIGPRTTDKKATLTQVAVGLEGNTRGIDWDISAGKGISEVSNKDSNYAQTELFNAAIANHLIDPTSMTNSEAEINKFRLTPLRTGKSELSFVNAKVSGAIMDLAGGPLSYATGVSYLKDTLADNPDQNQIDNLVFGSIQQAKVNASRSSKAVFAELSIPFIKNVEAQVAVRYDSIDKVGSKASPKLAIRYQPLDSLMVRASFAGSFLAPTLKQMYGGLDAGAEATNLPSICSAFPTLSGKCVNFPYLRVSGSNPDLKPETGKTYNLGFVFAPSNVVSLGVDYFKISKKNEIGVLELEKAIELGRFEIKAGEARILLNNQNLASTDVSGFDLDFRLNLAKTAYGKFSLRNSMTIYTQLDSIPSAGEPTKNSLGIFLNPRYRNTFTLNAEYTDFNLALIARTSGETLDSDLGKEKIPAGTPTIPSFTEVDFGAQYTGIKNLTLNSGIKNMFDKMPPYSRMGSLGQYGTLGYSTTHNPRGRFFYMSANYKFY